MTPLHAEYVKKGVKEGHGGMDWLVCRAFIESVKSSTPAGAAFSFFLTLFLCRDIIAKKQ